MTEETTDWAAIERSRGRFDTFELLEADERELLTRYLDWHRATLLWKVDGLDDEQLRRRVVPSRTTLLGLVKHLAHIGVPSPTGKPHWGVASVRGILTNPTYTGRLYVGRMSYRPPQIRRSATHPIGRPRQTGVPVTPQEWVPATTVPAVITEDQFQLAQAKLAMNQSFARRNNTVEPYLLRALVSCGQCGLSCMARKVQPRNTYYICTGKWSQVRRRTGTHCPSRFIPARQLDELVWNDLCELVRHPQIIAQALERAHAGHWLPQELQARCANLRRGHVSLQQQLERLTEAYLSGVIPLPEYQRRRGDLEQRQAALVRQEAQLLQQVQRLHEAAGLAASVEAFCQRVQASLATATFAQKRQLVELLIDRVIVTGEDVEIRYVIPTSEHSEHIRFCHLRLDYFGTPDLVHPRDGDPTQQVGVHAMPRLRLTRARFGIDRLQPHRMQQPRHPFGIHRVALLSQPHRHPAYPIEGCPRVLFIQPAHQMQILRTFSW
jgi:site-specific DNA recombinase